MEEKNMATVSNYKIEEANKFSLGMAINGAISVMAQQSDMNHSKFIETTEELAQKFYEMNLRLRQKNLGY